MLNSPQAAGRIRQAARREKREKRGEEAEGPVNEVSQAGSGRERQCGGGPKRDLVLCLVD